MAHTKCDHAPCPYERLFRLYWQDPDTGERHLLGEDFYEDKEAAKDLMTNYWDDRLDSTDCLPVILGPFEE